MKIRLQDEIINKIIINDAIRDLKQKRRPVHLILEQRLVEYQVSAISIAP